MIELEVYSWRDIGWAQMTEKNEGTAVEVGISGK